MTKEEEHDTVHPFMVGGLYEPIDRRWFVFETCKLAETALIWAVGADWDHTEVIKALPRATNVIAVISPAESFVVLDVVGQRTLKVLTSDGVVGYISECWREFEGYYFKKSI
jgi:hypothetical protein